MNEFEGDETDIQITENKPKLNSLDRINIRLFVVFRIVFCFMMFTTFFFLFVLSLGWALNYASTFILIISKHPQVLLTLGLWLVFPVLWIKFFWFAVQTTLLECKKIYVLLTLKQLPPNVKCEGFDKFSRGAYLILFVISTIGALGLILLGLYEWSAVFIFLMVVDLVFCAVVFFPYFVSCVPFVICAIPTIAALFIGMFQSVFLNSFSYWYFILSSACTLVYFLFLAFPKCFRVFVLDLSEDEKRKVIGPDFIPTGCLCCKRRDVVNLVFEIFSLILGVLAVVGVYSLQKFVSNNKVGSNPIVYYVLCGLWILHMLSCIFARISLITEKSFGFEKDGALGRFDSFFRHLGEEHVFGGCCLEDTNEDSDSGDEKNEFRRYKFSSYGWVYCWAVVFVGVSLYLLFETGQSIWNDKKLKEVIPPSSLGVRSPMPIPDSSNNLCVKDALGFSWVHYAYLSEIPYMDVGNLPNFTRNYFLDRGFTIKDMVNASISTSLHYTLIENTERKIMIVSFRGTYSIIDGMYDVKGFIESAMPNIALSIVPVPEQTQNQLALDFAFTGSRAFPGGDMEFIDTGIKVVKNLTESRGSDYTFVITGHSLGGAIANIVGSYYNITNYGVSPPGSELGRTMFGVSQESIIKYSNRLIPQRDPVAHIGLMSGRTSYIPCEESGSLKCHPISTTICMLGAYCSDAHNDLAPYCQESWDRWYGKK